MSQDTSAYGVDVRYRTGFWQGRPVKTRMTELARELDALARDARRVGAAALRLSVPARRRRDRADAQRRAGGGLLPYLDVPFQHASPRILKLMKRPGSAGARARARRARGAQAVPTLTLRSTFIVGFPGETEAEFDELLAFLEAAQLDRVGCFAYSPVEGAAANALPDPVAAEVQEARAGTLHGDAGADQRGAARGQASGRRRRCWSTVTSRQRAVAASTSRRSRAALPTRRRSTASCASSTAPTWYRGLSPRSRSPAAMRTT